MIRLSSGSPLINGVDDQAWTEDLGDFGQELEAGDKWFVVPVKIQSEHPGDFGHDGRRDDRTGDQWHTAKPWQKLPADG